MTLGRRLLQRLHHTPVYFWAGLLVMALLLVLALATQVGEVAGAVSVRQAQVEEIGRPGDAGRSVTLPHEWDPERRSWRGEARYRLELPERLADSQTAGRDIGLLLPRVGVRFRVVFNGQELAAECWRRGPGYCDAGTRAHFVTLPLDLMAPRWSDNRLEVQIRGQLLRISGLSPVWLGPRDALYQRYRWLDWWQVNLTWMVTASAFMMGMLSMLIWARTRETLFGLLGSGLLILTVRLWLSTPVFVAGPFLLWDYVHKLSFTLYCGFTYLFMSELFDFRQSLVRKLVVAMMVIGPFWLALQAWVQNYQLYRLWTGVIVLVCVLALLKVMYRARRDMNANQRLMMVVGVATMATGLRDFLVVQLGFPGDIDIRWMTPGSLVLMFAMGWVLVRRTAVAIEQVASLNTELARKVSERERELQAMFDRLRTVENQRVLETERRRLTRDMHDGLGSQLVQTLNLVRASGQQVDSGAVASMLNHALEELRMTLDSLEPMDGDLPTILGTLRQRIAPTLQAARIELDWQVEAVSAVPGLEVRGVMHLFRCLQEVFANAVQHAYATRVTVRTWEDGGRVWLSVSDNGVGLSEPPGWGYREGGRGIGNIRMRVADMGGEVAFSSGRPGTCVTFSFPSASEGATSRPDEQG